jgi:hypothetical protein
MLNPFFPRVLEQFIRFHNVIFQGQFGLEGGGVGLNQMPQFRYRRAAHP